MKSLSSWLKDLVIATIAIFGGIYLLMMIGSGAFSSQAPNRTPEVTSVPAGSEGRLNAGGSIIPVAIDQEAVPDLRRIVKSGELTGIGPMFVVNDDTLVRVSETGSGSLRVTVLTGSQKGRSGWVPAEWVKSR